MVGAKVADWVTSKMGTWAFVGLLSGFLALWFIWNSCGPHRARFDPHPFFVANLIMSAMATFTAPILLLSSNRQAIKDRETAEQTKEDSAADLKLDSEALQILREIKDKLNG